MDKPSQTLTLFLTLRSALVDYAASILGCRAGAEDVVQDAYMRFSAASEREQQGGRRVTHPSAYAYRTVRNLSLNSIRRQKTEAAVKDGADILESTPSQAPSPEHEALYRDELRAVVRALDQLPERTRRAFELHRLGGYSLHQVAEQMGISVGLAHALVREAITCCADQLGRDA